MPPGAGTSEDEMREAIVRQLVHCFGEKAGDPLDVAWTDWTRERATTPPSGSTCRGEEPRAAPPLSEPWWDGRLHFAAAETAHDHPGFLDGAIEAARRVSDAVSSAH
jgi:monoamine oxidase